MFYFCARCGNIESLKKVEECRICGFKMNEVPSEYLTATGSFFKSQKDRENLMTVISSGSEYDPGIASQREEIREVKEQEEKEAVEKMNRKLKDEQFKIQCPVCGSTRVQKISNVGKLVKVGAFGLLGADSMGKTWKCAVCNSKF